ncbi:MAG: flagellar basal body-associated FliL family protein [Phycisphaerae bacterium]
MAEEAKKPEKEKAEAAAAPKAKRLSMGTIGVFGGVMVLEGVGIFFAMKMLGADPDPTVGMENQLQVTTAPFEQSKEFEVARVRVQNDHGQRVMLYSATITVRVDQSKADLVEDFLKNRAATINDSVSRILRSAEEQQLAEPGLETLKRQIRFELSSLLRDETIIEQVLIPEFTPLPTGF